MKLRPGGKLLATIAFALGAGICTFAADSRESQIIDRERAFDSAWNKRDPQAMGNLITDDFVIVTRASTIMDRKAFLDGLKGGDFSVNAREAEPLPKDLLIRFYGPGTAVVTYSAEAPWGPASKQVPTLHRYDSSEKLVGGFWLGQFAK